MQLPINEALSGILGSVSLAAWIFLIVPQLWENFQNQSTEALSFWFLVIWLLGDVCNLMGAIWASLLPTVIGIGIYFCLIDSLMLGQVLYYNHYRPRKQRPNGRQHSDMAEPLLGSTSTPRPSQRRDSLSQVFTDEKFDGAAVRNTVSVVVVVMVGSGGWFIAWKAGAWNPPGDMPNTTAPLGALVLGYASSFFYLT
ncbi:hypothetical protein AA313_de0208044 [Arthrobotrys entomopaga]|nr:hypothetical protein AA313_de0208044 [Arthrobotrys entomopaga]